MILVSETRGMEPETFDKAGIKDALKITKSEGVLLITEIKIMENRYVGNKYTGGKIKSLIVNQKDCLQNVINISKRFQIALDWITPKCDRVEIEKLKNRLISFLNGINEVEIYRNDDRDGHSYGEVTFSKDKVQAIIDDAPVANKNDFAVYLILYHLRKAVETVNKMVVKMEHKSPHL